MKPFITHVRETKGHSLYKVGVIALFWKTKKPWFVFYFLLNGYSGGSVALGAGGSSPPVQAIIDIPGDLLTSRAMGRWHRDFSVLSPLPVHSGRVTKSSFMTESFWHSLPAKNQRDRLQSDQSHTYRRTCNGENTQTHRHTKKHPGTRFFKM